MSYVIAFELLVIIGILLYRKRVKFLPQREVPLSSNTHTFWPNCTHCGNAVAKYEHKDGITTCANCKRERG